MTRLKRAVLNNKLLSIVILSYALLGILMPGKAYVALQNSLYYVKEMLMIMPVILLITALITAWVPRETIEKNFGKSSGFKGSIYSFLLGSFSAGPLYAAFPVCRTLLDKGASISNIVVILSTWAVIKVPMLLNEAKFLGPKFMAIRWVLTTISIFTMGYIASRLVKKEDIPADKEREGLGDDVLYIDTEYCIGCGLCAQMAPEYFEMMDKKAMVISQDFSHGQEDLIMEAIDKCPPRAIRYDGIKEKA